MNSNFELMAASVPCLLILLHLLGKAADFGKPQEAVVGNKIVFEDPENVQTQQVVVVPEPSSMAVVGLGLTMLALWPRGRKADSVPKG